MDLCLVERVGNLVGENACRKARNNLCNVGFIRRMQNVVVDEYVVPEEGKLRENVFEVNKEQEEVRLALYFIFLKRPPTMNSRS